MSRKHEEQADSLIATPENTREMPDEPPPFLQSWSRVYLAVLGYLAGIISLLYLFTRAVSR